jgi:hypothetical protein
LGILSPRSRTDRLRRTVIVVALAVTALKLYLAATTQGTNDVFNFAAFARAIRTYGPIDIYGHTVVFNGHVYPVYNHPPLIGWMLVLFNRLSDLGIPFKFLIRVPASLADIVTSVLVFELVRHRRPVGQAAVAGVLVACSPALVIVSGFHGNTDPVFLMFAFLSLLLLVNERAPVWAGISYGLALSVKIIPIVALPVILLVAVRSGRPRVYKFLAGSAGVFLVLWVPVAVRRLHPFSQNVIGFKGYPGSWGLVEFATLSGFSHHATQVLENQGRTPLLLLSAGLPFLIAWRRPSASIPAFGMSLVLVLLLSTATGGRYLVWAIAAAYLIDVWAATVYNIAASVLLIVVYDRWSGGFPWNRAVGSPWTHSETRLAGIAWLALLAVAVVGCWQAWRAPPESDELAGDVDVTEPASESGPGRGAELPMLTGDVN